MRMPPNIKTGDLVRIEAKQSCVGQFREFDVLYQVMEGENGRNPNRCFSMDFFGDGSRAEYVTELYRYIEMPDGCAYKLIWHRPPRDMASERRFQRVREQEWPNILQWRREHKNEIAK